jgi:putative Mn2+ efflux pump MntP
VIFGGKDSGFESNTLSLGSQKWGCPPTEPTRMKVFDLILIAIGLAMDCFAVSIASGMSMKRLKAFPVLRMALLFGLFQAIMPCLGFLAGSTFRHLIESVDHWIAFGILLFLGGRMMYEQFHDHPESKKLNPYSWRVVLILAVATSIDALAVGISFAFLRINLLEAVSVIFLASFLFTLLGLFLGNRYCCRIRIPAELVGGLVLIAIGTKILLEHLSL